MEENKEKILVIMSTYNGEKYIKSQLDSIENQQLNIKLDILIRDDGSTDHTVDIIRNYQNKYRNIKLITGENIGCNASFFYLLKIADKYMYYAISDQDDVWLPNKLQVGIDEIKKIKENKPILYGSCSYIVDDDMKICGKTQEKKREVKLTNSIIQNFTPGHSQIMNYKLFMLLKQDNIDVKNIYVYDYWITNIAILYGRLIFNNEPYTYYRMHRNNAIGYGLNIFLFLKERIKRFQKGDGKKIYNQIKYFYEKNEKSIPKVEKKEINKFLNYNNNFIKRIKFVFTTKLYRQKKLETLFFKVAYLFKKY